jgi:hypothetical protein
VSRSTDLQDEIWRLAARYALSDVVFQLGLVVVRLGLMTPGMVLAGVADNLARQEQAASDNLPPDTAVVVDLRARLAEVSDAEARLSQQSEEGRTP